MRIAPTWRESWKGQLASAASLLLCALWLTACGFLGVDLLPLGLDGNRDGGPVGGGLDGSIDVDASTTNPDGSIGIPGNPNEVEVCVAGTCSAAVDRCPDDTTKTWPGICGCGVDDGADEDADGTPDCVDLCPGAPDVLSEGCGCGAAAGDSDGDGTPNCLDYCPSDPDKTGPATCGCNVSDQDGDGDGMPDCADGCAEDPDKLDPGLCGCGLADSDIDTDGDDVPDCIDTCGGLDDSQYVPDDSCGEGYCRTHNTPSSCVDGVETACEPGGPLADTDTTCDGIDDDCDGAVDDDYVATPTANTCGEGACTQNARLVCESGEVVERCQAGTNAPNDATCDGVDDDCDGTNDEDYQPAQTTCGTGACASTGTRSCVSGHVVDSCTPGPAAPNDATCDGIDEDCDGAADDNYQPTATSCGTGACGRTGSLLCSGGELVDTCVPGPAAGSDATCNGIDDDCDGFEDEEYQPTATSCGMGACARTGMRSCNNGQVVDSCTPGTAAGSDTSCNNSDDDCDGSTDEDYVPNATCGVGYCRTTNTPSTCAGGVETACVPGTKLSDDDATPDGVDDDCDGQTDENACNAPPSTYSNTGLHNVTVPAACGSATVHLWGGGGAGGEKGGWYDGSVARGGPGGYARQTFSVASGSSITLRIGQGGQGCGGAGSNGDANYNGGTGSTSQGGNGGAGAGSQAGGNGSSASSGGDGGNGRFGGGGGGAGSNGGAFWNPWGKAGGGGAASMANVNGVLLVAGGGGGGGGAGSIIDSSGVPGGPGGSGCGADGSAGESSGGGGGGGGACVGAAVAQRGTNGNPHVPSGVSLPAGRATGGSDAVCDPGGDGYAVIQWGP